MNNKILFLLPSGSLNDATEYYIDILETSFLKANYIVERSSILKVARSYRYILTIEAKWFFLAKVFNPKAIIINWFQGVVAEEAYMATNSIFRKKLWHFFESFTLRYSKLNIYVSERMRQYFEENYTISNVNYFIMPCFNKKLNLSLINKKKYETPSFVYAGSLAKWQCVEKTLELYSKVEKELDNATVTLLTKEKNYALELIKKYNIKNYDIKYVELRDLDVELSKYKYGFLLRENHIVNNVATPTKMNTYLSAGVIPIYSNVICDFNKNFKNYSDFIELKYEDTIEDWLDEIIFFEKNNKLTNFFKDSCMIFEEYYNEKFYSAQFKKLIEDL